MTAVESQSEDMDRLVTSSLSNFLGSFHPPVVLADPSFVYMSTQTAPL